MKRERTTLRTGSQGFSMLEIMFAIALLAFCLVPVLIFNQKNLQESGVTQEEIVARQMLINLCERFKNESPEVLQRIASNPQLISQDAFTKIDAAQQKHYQIERGVEFEKDYRGNQGIHRVSFLVRWRSPGLKRQREVRLSRLIHWHI